ncbi:MAG: tryptophan-rich sensory protein [Candidatus Gastranaerophilales bacterium]|nr:tryptophan-rich sensory protein [Candidatus Gastranaerophilales bacterium]
MRINYDFAEELNQPDFQPPAWAFNVVWPILYTLMFVSFYIFLNTKTTQSRISGVWIFVIQLGLNFLWIPVFFTFRMIKFALFISILLTLFVGYMILCFCKISMLSGLMNIPYFLWLIFAGILNFSLCKLNK